MARKKSKRLLKFKLFIFKVTTITIIITIIISALWIKHVDSICTDIYKATEYYMTESIFNSKKLLKISSMKLTFCDKKTAVVEVTGAKEKTPHESVTYKAYFTKAENDSWKLGTVYDYFQ